MRSGTIAVIASIIGLSVAAARVESQQGTIGTRGGQVAQGGARGGRGNQPLPTGIGVIEGVVQRADTKEPVDQATVELSMFTQLQGGRPPSSTVVTDSSGRFAFPNVALTEYALTVNRDGYFGRQNGVGASPYVTLNGSLSSSQPNTNIVISLSPTFAITGRVTDANGQPAATVQIDALKRDYANGQPTLVSVKTVTSDDRGEYRLFGLLPGEYFVRALAKPNSPYATTYYKVSPTSQMAELLDPAKDSDRVADIRLLRAVPVRISGQVVLPDAAATGIGRFFIRPKDVEFIDPLEHQVAIGRGSSAAPFQLLLNTPGSYELIYRLAVQIPRAATPQASRGPIYYARMDINAVRDLEGFVVNAVAANELEVRFNVQGNRTLTFSYALALVPKNGALPDGFLPALNTSQTIANRAAAQLRGYALVPEGEYVLNPRIFFGNPDSYISEMRQGSKDILGDGIIRIGKGPVEPVEIMFTRGAARVQGVVHDAAGKPTFPVLAYLIPDGTRRQNPLLYQRAPVDKDGKFDLRSVSPGFYKIFAWAADPGGAELYPAFIQQYEKSGVPIVVAAGSTATGITVSLIQNVQ